MEKVWLSNTLPEHIVNWNFARNAWACPKAYNDLRVGGTFDYRMESEDGKTGFNFEGTYTEVIRTKLISYQLSDARRVSVVFEQPEKSIRVVQSFDTDENADAEIQKKGWQATLDCFKLYTESL